MTRRWDTLPSNHLETLVNSSLSASNAVLSERINDLSSKPYSIIDSAYERRNTRESSALGTSKTAIEEKVEGGDDKIVVINNSLLHNPILLSTSNQNSSLKNKAGSINSLEENKKQTLVRSNLPPQSVETTLTVGSDYATVDIVSSNASRRFLNMKLKFSKEEKEINQLNRSLRYQRNILKRVDEDIHNLLSTQSASVSTSTTAAHFHTQQNAMREKSDSLALKQGEANRVIALLERKIQDLVNIHDNQTNNELAISRSVLEKLWDASLNVKNSFLDSYDCTTYTNDFTADYSIRANKRNSILSHLVCRNYGKNAAIGNRMQNCSNRRRIGMVPTTSSLNQRFEALLTKRMSHYVTVNCHLYCPIYCLRFDRTGQYFVTGADDNLVKLFRLGIPHYEGIRHHSMNKHVGLDKRRGAVLICTLRGHASVITDIDVSSDNTLLATASDDGDVRIWGMTDGCPIAILRGHTGGANMVSSDFEHEFHYFFH